MYLLDLTWLIEYSITFTIAGLNIKNETVPDLIVGCKLALNNWMLSCLFSTPAFVCGNSTYGIYIENAFVYPLK